jgi:hypothetical protein
MLRRLEIFEVGIGQWRSTPEVLDFSLHRGKVKLDSIFQSADPGKLAQAFLQVFSLPAIGRHRHLAI